MKNSTPSNRFARLHGSSKRYRTFEGFRRPNDSIDWSVFATAFTNCGTSPTSTAGYAVSPSSFPVVLFNDSRHSAQANEQKLSITSRPAYFDCWMKAHRPLKKGRVPTLNHDEQLKFLSEFQNWWSSLQPGWRTLLHSDAFTRTGPLHSDWESLSRASPNGVALVVLSLAWLTAYFRSDNPLFSTFVLYIEDTTWAFLQVIQWMEASPHIISSITHEPPSSSPSPKKKARRNK